jgi:hypoxanthine phosphoribosyltransferase
MKFENEATKKRLDVFSTMYNSSTSLIPEHVVKDDIFFLSKAIVDELREVENLLVVTVLQGGMMTSALIQQHLSNVIPFEIGTIHTSTYEENVSTGNVKIRSHSLPYCMKERTVLLIDDIFDKGLTLSFLHSHIKNFWKAKEVYSAVLLNKDVKKETDYRPNFIGRNIPDVFVFGMGMDVSGLWRGLPEVRKMNT